MTRPRRHDRLLIAAALFASLCLPLLLAGCQLASAEPEAKTGALAGMVRLVSEEAVAGAAADEPAKRLDTGDSLFGVKIYLGGTDRVARADSSGNFRFDGLAPGPYEIMAEREGYLPASAKGVEVVAGRTASLGGPIELVKDSGGGGGAFGSLTGQARLAGGSPPASARVEVTAVSDKGAAKTVSDADGNFAFSRLSPGLHTLYFRATAPGFQVASRTVDVFPGDNALPEAIALRPVGDAGAEALEPAPASTVEQMDAVPGAESLYGSVVFAAPDSVKALVYASASLQLEAAIGRYAGFDEEGNFSFPALEPGVYALTLQSADIELVEPVQVEIKAGQNTLLVLQARYVGDLPVEGEDELLEEPEAEEGVAELTGYLILADPSAAPSAQASLGGTSLSAKPDRQGFFRLSGVPLGTYDLFASAKGHVGFAETIAVDGPGVIDLGEIFLELDVKAPRVVATDPPDGTRDIPVDEVVAFTIEFDQDMDPASVKAAFSIKPEAAHALFMGAESPLSSDRVLYGELYGFEADNPLEHNKRYRLSVAESARSLDGVPMREPFSFGLSTSKPAIIDTYPADGASEASISANEHLLIYCNAPIDARNLNSRMIDIKPNRGGSDPILRVSTDGRTGWGVLEVSFPFEENTEYRVRVNSRLRTEAGSGFANTPYDFSFKTGTLRTRSLDDVATGGRRVGRSQANRFRGNTRPGHRWEPELGN